MFSGSACDMRQEFLHLNSFFSVIFGFIKCRQSKRLIGVLQILERHSLLRVPGCKRWSTQPLSQDFVSKSKSLRVKIKREYAALGLENCQLVNAGTAQWKDGWTLSRSNIRFDAILFSQRFRTIICKTRSEAAIHSDSVDRCIELGVPTESLTDGHVTSRSIPPTYHPSRRKSKTRLRLHRGYNSWYVSS